MKYELHNEVTHEFLVNSFHLINWPEPFSEPENLSKEDVKDISMNKKIINNPIETLIYSSSKIFGVNSPMAIYIPNKVIMFKLMRSCIDHKVGQKQFWEI